MNYLERILSSSSHSARLSLVPCALWDPYAIVRTKETACPTTYLQASALLLSLSLKSMNVCICLYIQRRSALLLSYAQFNQVSNFDFNLLSDIQTFTPTCITTMLIFDIISKYLQVYWSNGAQIISPHDLGIQEHIEKNLKPQENYWLIDEETLKPMLRDPYEPAYFEALKNQIPKSFISDNGKCLINFVYTAMHGVGKAFVEKAFKQVNMKPFIPVKDQVEPDPDFPTTPMPNPEEGKESLDLALKTATESKCEIILANDPDADRLAVAEIGENGKYKLFSGNEMGALLGWWVLLILRTADPDADIKNCVMIASTVSSKILKSMAAIEGFIFHETLTGFKWMANKAIEEESAGKKVLFAFEEAIGFMISTVVPDKDGVSAAAHVATMARYLYENKLTLQKQLEKIYDKYGYHTSICSYVSCSDQKLIQQIFNRLRTFDNGQVNTYPKSILNGDFEIEHVRDLTTGYDNSKADLKATLPVSSNSQMITFTFKNGVVVTLRTSGTEPKMKYYAEICGKPEDKNWAQLSATLERMVEAIVNEFYEPEKHKLQRKSA